MDSAVSRMDSAKIPGSNSTLIDMLLSSMRKQSESTNKEVMYKIEVASGKAAASRDSPADQREPMLGPKKDLLSGSAECRCKNTHHLSE